MARTYSRTPSGINVSKLIVISVSFDDITTDWGCNPDDTKWSVGVVGTGTVDAPQFLSPTQTLPTKSGTFNFALTTGSYPAPNAVVAYCNDSLTAGDDFTEENGFTVRARNTGTGRPTATGRLSANRPVSSGRSYNS